MDTSAGIHGNVGMSYYFPKFEPFWPYLAHSNVFFCHLRPIAIPIITSPCMYASPTLTVVGLAGPCTLSNSSSDFLRKSTRMWMQMLIVVLIRKNSSHTSMSWGGDIVQERSKRKIYLCVGGFWESFGKDRHHRGKHKQSSQGSHEPGYW